MKKAQYVDGFVAAVPTANREAYRHHAEIAAAVFKENGALSVVECWGNDVPDGEVTSFPMAVQRQADETVVFAWITFVVCRHGAVLPRHQAQRRPRPLATPSNRL